MSEFRITPEYLNQALEAARVEGMHMSRTWRGQLWINHDDLSFEEVVDRLVGGIALLCSQLLLARAEARALETAR